MRKEERKRQVKTTKKGSKDEKRIKLKLDNDAKVLAKTIYKKASDFFEISDIDINKIRGSALRESAWFI